MTMSNDWWRGTQIQNLLVAHELHLRRNLILVWKWTISLGYRREIDEIGLMGERRR